MHAVSRVVFGSEMLQFSLQVIVIRKGDLVELDGISVNICKCILLLFHDCFLQHADILAPRDADSEDVSGIIVESKTVEHQSCALRSGFRAHDIRTGGRDGVFTEGKKRRKAATSHQWRDDK
jgi:hypothetical protein